MTAFNDDPYAWVRRRLDPELIGKANAKALALYVSVGQRAPDFMHSVLANDLLMAVRRADPKNRDRLHLIIEAMLDVVPQSARGGYEQVATWCEHRGARGLQPT